MSVFPVRSPLTEADVGGEKRRKKQSFSFGEEPALVLEEES